MRIAGSKSLALLLPLLLALPPRAWAADEAQYRLTGIMGSSTGMAFAVIEDADGQQKLLREGSAIGQGHVKSISSGDKVVVLAFPTGEVSLRLSGSGKPVEVQKAFSLEDYSEEVVQKSLNPANVTKLADLAASADKVSESELAAQVNAALGLPAQARIAGYNHEPVESTRALLERMSKHISGMSQEDDFLGSIAVSSPEGNRRMYLSVGAAAE